MSKDLAATSLEEKPMDRKKPSSDSDSDFDESFFKLFTFGDPDTDSERKQAAPVEETCTVVYAPEGFKLAEEVELTDEELKLYDDAVCESGGFDVPELPDTDIFGLIYPLKINDHSRKHLVPLSRLALDDFKTKHGQEYEFVDVVKATYQAANMMRFYVIFEARLPGEEITKTFEAVGMLKLANEADAPNYYLVEYCDFKKDKHNGNVLCEVYGAGSGFF